MDCLIDIKSVIETFKDIPGYEGLYQVSDYGCVRSLYDGKVKYLRYAKRHDGYCKIGLYRDGKRKSLFVHRLVWEAFNGPIPDGYEIDHVNTIRGDNRLSNLRVATPKENRNNPITLVRKRETNQRLAKDPKWIENVREGIRKALNKPVLQLDKVTGEVIQQWECARDVERELGINQSKISLCCHGKQNTAGGFKWEFA